MWQSQAPAVSMISASTPRCVLHIPLDAGQDGRDIVRRAPPVLQNVEAELARRVHVGVEHLTDELDRGRLVGVLLLKVHHQSESAVLKRGIGRSNDDGVPIRPRQVSDRTPKDDREPGVKENEGVLVAHQVMTLSGTGEAETPAGGSVCMRCLSIRQHPSIQTREASWATSSRKRPVGSAHLEVSHETAASCGRHRARRCGGAGVEG